MSDLYPGDRAPPYASDICHKKEYKKGSKTKSEHTKGEKKRSNSISQNDFVLPYYISVPFNLRPDITALVDWA